MKQVNNGFATLQQHIPSIIVAKYDSCRPSSNGAAKKLSKVETLRMAVEYIRSLEKLLDSSPTTPSEGSVENQSNVDDFNFTDDSMSLSSQVHEDSNMSSNQYFDYSHNGSQTLDLKPNIDSSTSLNHHQHQHQHQLPERNLTQQLSTDDSLMIENNLNFTELINAPNEIVLESESLYEPSFNNNNSNQNRNFVIMKPSDTSSQIVDCNGTNVIIWWQQQQQQHLQIQDLQQSPPEPQHLNQN